MLRLSIKLLLGLVILWPALCQATCNGVACTCVVLANPVAFGNYDPTTSTPTDSTGNVNVTCTALTLGLDVSYTITLSQGNAASFSPRKMTSGSNDLAYNLYTDSTRTLVWGDGTSSTNVVTDSYNQGILTKSINYTVYGRIPALQSTAGAGLYTDSIVVTVTY